RVRRRTLRDLSARARPARDPTGVRSVRLWLGSVRDAGLPRQRAAFERGPDLVPTGRRAHPRPRAGARDRARQGARAVRLDEGRAAHAVRDARLDGPVHGGRPVVALARLIVAHGGTAGLIVEISTAVAI